MGVWSQNMISKKIQNIKQWNIQKLSLQQNQHPQILRDIANSHIKFGQLKIVFLSCNKLVSLQALCCIEMPLLQKIDLSHNQLTNILSFKKVKLNKLVKIGLQNNQIISIKGLSQMNAPLLGELRFQTHIDKPACFDARNIIQAESNKLTTLYVFSKARVPQSHVWRKLRAKCGMVAIFIFRSGRLPQNF